MTREGDVHIGGNTKVAWFKDPDGNILNIASDIRKNLDRLSEDRLINECRLRICPVPLGKGRPLFPDDLGPVKKKLLAKAYGSGLVLLRYGRPSPE
jgi:hypothetical protein